MEANKSTISTAKHAIIESLITCSLCNKLIETPMQCIQCEHSYCKTCIDNWTKANSSSSAPLQCPSKCPKPVYQPSRIIRELITLVSTTTRNKEILFKDNDNDTGAGDKGKSGNTTTPKSEFDQKYRSLVVLYENQKEENSKLKSKESNSNQFKSKLHSHTLTYIFVNRNAWICNGCRGHFGPNGHGSYYCGACDFDLCNNCRKKELV